MTSVAELVNNASDRDPLLQGLSVLSQYQAISFSQYIRYVLPLDGYIFWLRTKTAVIQGSLHVSVDKQQREDETIAINRVVFTTGELVQEFNEIDPNTIWIGESNGVKFAFSQQAPFYHAAGLYHYSGNAVYPALLSQLVDVGDQLDPTTLVVSNSLPAWLTLQSYTPIWLVGPNPDIPLFPSYAVPDNLPPVYGAVHIEPGATQPIGAFPVIGNPGVNGYHGQLASDQVHVTLYGATNDRALAWFDLVNQFSRDTNTLGMMEPAIMRDQKREQAELGILAMKKTINFKVSYLQQSMPDVARVLIEKATATMLPQPDLV